MTETTPAYLATPPDAPSDARDWLRAQLSRGVEETSPSIREFLGALHWRQRAVVCLLYAERMTQERVAWLLGVSRQTVYTDLCAVLTLVEGAKK